MNFSRGSFQPGIADSVDQFSPQAPARQGCSY